jgi:asparagine synthase (glutamine-hydrolysing)
MRRWDAVPKSVFAIASTISAKLPAGVHGRRRITAFRDGPLSQMVLGTNYFDSALRRRILTKDARGHLGDTIDEPERQHLELLLVGQNSVVDALARFDFKTILADDYLVKVDRASMAHGLEIRAPFLDHRLVEFCFSSIPNRWKVNAHETRRLERILAKRWLPTTLNFDRKQGFSVPMETWFRKDDCQVLRERISDLPVYINRAEVNRLITGQMRGRNNASRLFALTMLAIATRNNGWA